MRIPTLFIGSLVLFAGCGNPGDNSETVPEGAATYYKDVKPLLDAHCTGCHVEGGIAPFALTTYEEVKAVAPLVHEAVTSGTMPPVPAAPAVRPFRYDSSLDEDQVALIAGWIQTNTPMGDPADAGEPVELDRRVLSRVDETVEMSEAFTATVVPDEYRCFIMDFEVEEPTYITGFDVIPGSVKVAHHAALYIVGAENAAVIDAEDGADGKYGYDCFGGPSPTHLESFPAKLLGGWAPGSEGGDFPAGTGTRFEPGARLILQMHYSTVEGAEPDQTAVQLKVDSEVPKEAGYMPFFDVEWITNRESMLIPAGEAQAVHEYTANPADWPLLGGFIPGVDPSEGMMIHAAYPHQHKLGTEITLDVLREDGSVEPVIAINRWDFDWQLPYDFVEPVFVGPNDELELRCVWDNSATNQPIVDGARREPQDVTFGEGTYDEMCVGTIWVTGVAEGSPECAELGSIPADSGVFEITFDGSAVRGSSALEGELRGPVWGSIYRAEDVTVAGPKDGTESVASFQFEEIDLTEDVDGPYLIETELPAGDYQFLGFMDTDGNADPDSPSPDVNDPVMIPARATTLQCAKQSVTLSFPILRPDF